MSDGGIAAALQQLAQLRAELSQIQGQVTSNWVKLSTQLHQVAAQLAAMGSAAADQGEVVAALAADVDALRQARAGGSISSEDEGYSAIPAPRWWLLAGEERAAAVARLADWVRAVYVPGYGKLAERLPACWAEHPLCLVTLDWLSELFNTLWIQPERGAGMLAAQAEWQTRLLPAAVDQMAAECESCQHVRPALNGARR